MFFCRPSRQQILRHCKYLIRRLEYEEITKSDPLKAVNYLQTRLHDIIDHKDPEELKEVPIASLLVFFFFLQIFNFRFIFFFFAMGV